MHAGTTVDTFLRENLVSQILLCPGYFILCFSMFCYLSLCIPEIQDWLSRATNWAKFSATAGLGVIHRGHLQQGRSLMAPYLPQGGAAGGGGSPYSEGGALYALGLIHANHGEGIKQFLRESLRSTNVEVLLNNGVSSHCQEIVVSRGIYNGFLGAGYSTWCMLRSWFGSSRNC